MGRSNIPAREAAVTQKTCEYCGQEERYGHDAPCVMNIVAELTRDLEIWKRNGGDILLRAEIEQLKAENARQLSDLETVSGLAETLEAEVKRLHAGIRDAVEALERNSTSAPVLEALRALVTKP